MFEICLNPFYNGDPLEPEEPIEEVAISYKYQFDYSNNLIYIIEIHNWYDGNDFYHYKGDIPINRITEEQTQKMWNSGNASKF